MSFFKEIVAEFKTAIDEVTAELGDDIKTLDKEQQNIGQHIHRQLSQSQRNQSGQVSSNTNRVAPIRNQSSSKSTKGTKKSGTKKAIRTEGPPPTVPPPRREAGKVENLGTKRIPYVKAHTIVADLNPETARNAIVLAEVLGPPVSKRQQKSRH